MPRRSSSNSRPENTGGREKRQSTRRTNVGTKRIKRTRNSSRSRSRSTRRGRGSGNASASSSVLSSRTQKAIDTLPSHAQEIYRKAHKNALKQYTSPSKRRGGKQQSKEQVAHKVAWSAVKKEYKKKGDKWLPKKD
jgi:cation transport regulator